MAENEVDTEKRKRASLPISQSEDSSFCKYTIDRIISELYRNLLYILVSILEFQMPFVYNEC